MVYVGLSSLPIINLHTNLQYLNKSSRSRLYKYFQSSPGFEACFKLTCKQFERQKSSHGIMRKYNYLYLSCIIGSYMTLRRTESRSKLTFLNKFTRPRLDIRFQLRSLLVLYSISTI